MGDDVPDPSSPPVPFLPIPLIEKILPHLPAPQRLRCREVCRAWRELLSAPRFWRVLDLSAAGAGVVCPPARSEAFRKLLAAASAAAAGSAELLCVPAAAALVPSGEDEEGGGGLLASVLRANAASLRALRLCGDCPGGTTDHPLLPEVPPEEDLDMQLLQLATGNTLLSTLRDVFASANEPLPVLGPDEPALNDFCAAVQEEESRLEEIDLSGAGLWRRLGESSGQGEQHAAGVALIEAMQGHPTLRSIRLDRNDASGSSSDVAGEAIAGLVKADSSALRSLSFSGCGLDAFPLAVVFDALRQNTHLERLDCRQGGAGGGEHQVGGGEACSQEEEDAAAQFVRDRVLPAVTACTSLRELVWDDSHAPPAEAVAVADVLAGR